MKKYRRIFSTMVLFAIIALGLSSCLDDDGYPLDKYLRSIATVNEVGENTYDFTLDDGTKLWVAAPVGLNLKPKYKRAIIDYTILSDEQNAYDHYVKLNRFFDVLTKGVIYIGADDKVKQDSIGYDPVKVHSIWEGGDYMNISFGFNSGGGDAHMINLVSAKPDLSVNEGLVKLEFRHNQKNDPEHYPSKGYVSFDLTPYKISGRDKVTFELTWKDFDGQTKTYKLDYKYSDATGSVAENRTLNIENDTNLNIF